MKGFCKELLEFLHNEYADSYQFDVTVHQSMSKITAVLLVKYGKGYIEMLDRDLMEWLYELYCKNEYIEEQKMYKWQYELVDLIEGG